MIRLNQSSNKRRPPRASNNSSSDDNSISDLLGPSNNTSTSNVNGATATTPEADRLFNELLGDNASGIASKEAADDESSAMSSIFSGLLDKYKKNRDADVPTKGGANGAAISRVLGTSELDRIPENPMNESHDTFDNRPAQEMNTNQKPQDQLSNLLNSTSSRNKLSEKEEHTYNEEDTLITKPREISFDPASDDVSALFGGGGVSTTANQVESYMGTYAKQRQNRRSKPSSGGGGGLFGNFGNATSGYNSSRLRKDETVTRASSRQSGVESLLDDIGNHRNNNSNSIFSDNYQDEENKGHATTTNKRHFRSTSRKKTESLANPSTFLRKLLKGNQTTWILLVLIVYVVFQIPTVQKRDKMTMRKFKRESRHKYDRFENGGNYDDGMGEGHELRRAGMRRREVDQEEKQKDSALLRGGGLKSSGIIHADKDTVVDSVDDMAIFSKQTEMLPQQHLTSQKHSFDKHTMDAVVSPQEDMTDDKKAALMKPPDDPPSMIDRHVIPVDKLNDIDPVKEETDPLPSKYRAFASVKTPYIQGRDTPFFWHIPRSGGVIVKTLMSHCLKMTLAAEVGELGGHDQDEELQVVTLFDHNYTNVNVATADGIERALSKGLVPSHLADVIVSAQVDKIPQLFTSNEHARAFALFRNPVDRAVSMFYFLQSMGNERLKNMTLSDYAKSDMIENNWLVRVLSDSMTGPIDSLNLDTAQLLLKEKFVVGILDNKRGSFARFDHYFKWKENPNYEKEFGCIKQIMDEKYVPKHPLRKGDETWNLVFEQNRFDMQLYEYAKTLFKEQSSYIFGL